MNNKKRYFFDASRNSLTIFSTLLSVVTFLSILIYVFITGSSRLSLKFITSDYQESLTVVTATKSTSEFTDPNIENTYFSKYYGIAIKDDYSVDGEKIVSVAYIAVNSPFNKLITSNENETYQISKGESLDVLIGIDEHNEDVFCSSSSGAAVFATELDKVSNILYLQCTKSGGGIRGSLIATIYLILLTLLFSLPLGVCASIYLVLYAKEGKFKTVITNLIDATSGIPSIIFGFVGAIIFIPFVSTITSKNSYSILSGALTMTIVLLPTIIKTTSEALLVVPNSYMGASLALGASKTQTIFKVILPNAIPGILTSAILSVGRIIGESAALLFVMGTAIKDQINILEQATSLSLHIWSITKAENPNYEAACAISIIILTVVFLMNIIVKIISIKYNKKRGNI